MASDRWQPPSSFRVLLSFQGQERTLTLFCDLRVLEILDLCEGVVPEEPATALGLQTDRVPQVPGLEEGSATLAAWCKACISTTSATLALAWEGVSVDIHAANIPHSNTHIAPTTVTASTIEWCSVSVVASDRWQPPSSF